MFVGYPMHKLTACEQRHLAITLLTSPEARGPGLTLPSTRVRVLEQDILAVLKQIPQRDRGEVSFKTWRLLEHVRSILPFDLRGRRVAICV